jgi:two-component system, NarL family, response regulator NreC
MLSVADHCQTLAAAELLRRRLPDLRVRVVNVVDLMRRQPDVVVIDIEMPGMGGIEGAARIRERAPDARVLFLSMYDQARDVRRAFDAGADGYLLKSAADEDHVRAIRALASWERYVHPALGRPWRHRPPTVPSASSRTASARCCAARLGHTNHEIAERLIVSVRAVESHRAHAMTKLRIATRAGLVRAALDAGLLAEED